MRITKSTVMLGDAKQPILVKEYAKNYTECNALDTPDMIVKAIQDLFYVADMAEEYAYLIAMDTKCNILNIFELSHGSACYTSVGVREIMIRLLLSGATTFVILHNHLTGDVKPSKEDIAVTDRLSKASKIIGISFLDHIILGRKRNGDVKYLSFKEKGMLQ